MDMSQMTIECPPTVEHFFTSTTMVIGVIYIWCNMRMFKGFMYYSEVTIKMVSGKKNISRINYNRSYDNQRQAIIGS